jgi:hypothetical protein
MLHTAQKLGGGIALAQLTTATIEEIEKEIPI